MHVIQQLDPVQLARSPKHDEHAPEYPSALSMQLLTHDDSPMHWCAQVDIVVRKFALPVEFHTAWSARLVQATVSDRADTSGASDCELSPSDTSASARALAPTSMADCPVWQIHSNST